MSRRSPSRLRSGSLAIGMIPVWVGFFTILVNSTATADPPSFMGLGDLGAPHDVTAQRVSADGTTVVGAVRGASGTQAFRWTRATGMIGLGDLPGSTQRSGAHSVSADGSVVVGFGTIMEPSIQAFRWTAAQGMVGLGGDTDSHAEGTSGDGSVVVGQLISGSVGQPFIWTAASGMVGLGHLPGGSASGLASAVSADGIVVVGGSSSANSGNYMEAFRWTPTAGMVPLGDLPAGNFESIALNVSADGRFVVGYGSSAANHNEAFVWTQQTGMVGLGVLQPSNYGISEATAITADGTTIVGLSTIANGSAEAFIWNATHGMRRLADVLTQDYGLSIGGWRLAEATDITPNGRTILGVGTDPNGYSESWIAHLYPCPAVFQSQPASTTTCPTRMATFGVTAAGAGQLTYLWQRETAPNSNTIADLTDGPTAPWDGGAPGVGGIVSGASIATLTIAADTANGRVLTAAHAIRYRCTITDQCGTVNSDAAMLTLLRGPTISIHPASQTACGGGSATFSVVASAVPNPAYQWRKNGQDIASAAGASLTIAPVTTADAGTYDVVVGNVCGTVTSNPALLTIGGQPAPHYTLTTLCPSSTIDLPYFLSFTDDGRAANYLCGGQHSFRLFAGRIVNATGKLLRIRQDCTVVQFGPTICGPDSVLIDVNARWPLFPAPLPNLTIAGGACNTIYFINPASGGVLETFDDPAFAYIGQIAIDSTGRLFVGSVNGDCLSIIDMGARECFYSAPGLSPRAVSLGQNDNVYLTCAADGVMRKLAPDGSVINAAFASGSQGAISQAIAPPGIFHSDIFVACGDRVMEVDATTGASSTFLSCHAAAGIAFDPEGYMYVSVPSQNTILKIGPGLPGDMNGDGVVNLTDLPGFVAAVMQTPTALLPILTADMNADGCADGADVQAFVNLLIP